MIILEGATKFVKQDRKIKRTVLSSVTLTIPSNRRIALLGPSREDNKLLIEVISGIVLLNAGHIHRRAQVSFPVGVLRGVEIKLPVRVNVAHVARIYGIDADQTIEFVRHLLDIGDSFDRPYQELSGAAKKAVAQVVGLSLPFDAYVLADDTIGLDKDFREKCLALFEARSRTSGMIIPTQRPRFAREHCDMAMVLDRGKLALFDNVDEGLEFAKSWLPPGPHKR